MPNLSPWHLVIRAARPHGSPALSKATRMTDLPDDAALETEFDSMLARAGMIIPADRRAATVQAYRELRQQVALLRQPRDATHEPSNIFRLPTP